MAASEGFLVRARRIFSPLILQFSPSTSTAYIIVQNLQPFPGYHYCTRRGPIAVPKIAINGFGRIGRIVTRLAKMRRHFDVVAINDLSDPAHLAYVFKYDSVHGIYPGDVRLEGDRP